MKKQIILITLTLITILVSVSAVSAADIYVNSSITTPGDGSSWDLAYKNITDGYTKANNNGDTINLADGQYTGAGNTNITITKNITIQGQSQAGTIINGTGNYQIFRVNSTFKLILNNLTLTNGTGTEAITTTSYFFRGGAIYNLGNLIIENCSFIANVITSSKESYGGAISNRFGNLTVTNCTFTGNKATFGGAIDNEDGLLNVVDSIFTNNTASSGGAISAYRRFEITNCNVTGCTFTSNSANTGGAIDNLGNNFELHYNRIIENTGHDVSGIVNATDNWWGSNSPVFSSLIIGASAPTQWLFMTINATPSTITKTQTSLVTVSFNNLYNGNTITPYIPNVGEYIPDGTPVTFSLNNGPFGTLTTPLTVNTVGGIASILFTASQFGVQEVNGTLDDQNVNAFITISPVANLTITKTGPATVTAGNSISYTVTVVNNGPDIAENVHIQDIFPASLSGVSWTVVYSNGTTIPGTGNLDISSISLLAGDSCTITVTGTVLSSVTSGTIINNTANVTSTSRDLDMTDNSATALTTVNTQYEITINKTVDKARPNVGETVTFTVTAHNNGPSDALNVQISDLMPSDFTDIIITPSKGTYDIGTGIWTLNLTSGETATLNLTGKVSVNMAGKNTTNIATLVETANSTNATIYVPKSNLYIKITSSNKNPKVGETFTITYKLGNYGPDNATNVTITIPLPKGFELGDISGNGDWTYNPTTNTITWTLSNVPVGDPYLYISGRLPQPGLYVFSASISSETYNINTEGVTPITINAVTEVNAATVGMQKTGLPIAGLVLAILAVLGGLVSSKRK